MGTRLMPLTKDIPKALLKINELTLLERMIKNCISADISKFIVIVGYNRDKVTDLCPEIARKYDVEIKTLVNEDYEVTNTSVSTYIACKFIEKNPEDFILINGDNVVDPIIIKRLVKSQKTSLIVDNARKPPPSWMPDGDEIEAIGKQLDISSSSGEFIGVSKVNKEDISDFINILEDLIDENPQNYYDFAYKELSKIKPLNFVLTNGLKWTEIDDYKDWEKAQIIVSELENQNSFK